MDRNREVVSIAVVSSAVPHRKCVMAVRNRIWAASEAPWSKRRSAPLGVGREPGHAAEADREEEDHRRQQHHGGDRLGPPRIRLAGDAEVGGDARGQRIVVGPGMRDRKGAAGNPDGDGERGQERARRRRGRERRHCRRRRSRRGELARPPVGPQVEPEEPEDLNGDRHDERERTRRRQRQRPSGGETNDDGATTRRGTNAASGRVLPRRRTPPRRRRRRTAIPCGRSTG